MRLLRRLVFIAVCVVVALTGARITYEPGRLFYQTGVSLHLPAQESVPAVVEALKQGKERLESEEFRMQAAARLTALQIRHVRQLGPSQLVDNLEGSQACLAGFLSRACVARFDESVPALILSISAESQPLVNAMATVLPELLTQVHESDEAIALTLLASKTLEVLSGAEQADKDLTQVLWNLKGALNTKFADRPISGRGAITSPATASVAEVLSSTSVEDVLAAMRGKMSQKVGVEQMKSLDKLPSLAQAWQQLGQALQLRDRLANLMREASALFSTVDSATSMESGPLPENLARLTSALLEAREQGEALAGQSAQMVPTGSATSQSTFVMDQSDLQLVRVGGQNETFHYLVWGLCGLGTGVLFCLAGGRRHASKGGRG